MIMCERPNEVQYELYKEKFVVKITARPCRKLCWSQHSCRQYESHLLPCCLPWFKRLCSMHLEYRKIINLFTLNIILIKFPTVSIDGSLCNLLLFGSNLIAVSSNEGWCLSVFFQSDFSQVLEKFFSTWSCWSSLCLVKILGKKFWWQSDNGQGVI